MDVSTPSTLIAAWIGRQATPDAVTWLTAKREDLSRDPSGRTLAATFGMVPRRLGKAPLILETGDLAAAAQVRPGWSPRGLSVDQAGRILLLLDGAAHWEAFPGRLQALVSTADLGESIAVYKGLPLYPDQPSLTPLATDGLRTAMRAVFEAVAHGNPFPAEQFSQSAWNHMVLKTLFIDSTLHPIVGLDRRWNEELARILCDYAHERWAAHRPVTPELWRGVGRFADEAAILDLTRVLTTDTPTAQKAAALALSENGTAAARHVLESRPDLAAGVASGRTTWDNVGEAPLA